MKIQNLFKLCITEIWQDAQNKRISWDHANTAIMHIYEAVRSMGADKRYTDALFWLGQVCWELESMAQKERLDFMMADFNRRLLQDKYK